jgi:hypothetical protein
LGWPLPRHCRHGGMTELEEAEMTDGQGRALFAHKSQQAYEGQSYVVMDASGAFSLAEREAGIARMVQRGVILTDYFAITVEMMRSNADPRSNEVYAALDMDFAVLVGQISKADAAKAQKSSRSVAA